MVRGQDRGDLHQPSFSLVTGGPRWNMLQKKSIRAPSSPEPEDSDEVQWTRLARLQTIQDSLGAAM